MDQKKLRHVAGAFPTGVTVVTVQDENGDVIGMTASSFVSISLDPPNVGFFVQDSAGIMDNIRVGTKMGISILSDKQKLLSDKFAGILHDEVDVKFKQMGDCFVIPKSIAKYETTVVEIIRTGDHFFVLCEVKNLSRSNKRTPLVYYSGYRKVGKEVNK
ncbi:MAG: flavin reductase family protein [Saprospiraceae bacterium]|nr:flavin reductase family protein [Bacteroidia bacterium]NNE15599.1 flavin reductase family protein [Saprospiraceae bacterium]NNL93698.1 flavin reductase family protein [Saprospiraceae bacterium]